MIYRDPRQSRRDAWGVGLTLALGTGGVLTILVLEALGLWTMAT